MPIVSSVSISGESIDVTGTNFFTSGYTAHLKFGGVEAETVAINSDTSIEATFDYGVPHDGIGSSPEVWFEIDDSSST